jgi:hypothetical protein
VRQAIFLAKSGDLERAEETLLAGLSVLPEEGLILGQLGWLYKSWQPTPRATDARAHFARAVELGSGNVQLFRHWVEMERMEEQWSKAIDLGSAALQEYPGDQYLKYLTGYAHWRRGAELLQQFQPIGLGDYVRAESLLGDAVIPSAEIEDPRDRITNSKAFNALTRCLADHIRSLVSSRDPEDTQEVGRLRSRLGVELTRWRSESPGDPYGQEAIARLSDVAWLGATPPSPSGESDNSGGR